MTAVFVVLAAAVAVAAALRSTWSPCGLSMLSSITPMAEAGRGNRYSITATWFVAGAVLGGATVGVGAALLALGVAALDASAAARAGVLALGAAIAVTSDLHLGGFRLPAHGRQVNERWLDQYRAWVYAGGFGWQIGTGFATYITTAAVYLMVLAAALTASPLAAFAVVTCFGLIRGLAVLAARSLTTPARLAAFHRWLDAALPAAQRLVVLVQVAVGSVATAVAWGPVPAVVVGALGLGAAVGRRPRPATRATPRVAPA